MHVHIPCMEVDGLVADGDLFEPVVAMEIEQERCDHKNGQITPNSHTHAHMYT